MEKIMNLIIEQNGRTVIVRLNRPEVLNALNSAVMHEMVEQLTELDRDPNVGCFVITGNERAFAAGADIKELASKSYMDMFHEDFFAPWDQFAGLRTPKIAAVSGYALGGGCELAMMCDLIYAADTAKFGQPEIKLGLIPGMGGSQRLTKLVGKAKAMDMLLTGRMMDAAEAERAGLVARVLPAEDLMAETLAAAEMIGCYGKTAVIAAREAVERALEGSLREGILFERRTYYALWATADANEGMQAFLEKRQPAFAGR
jgi:enoyl-CoA hydratase